MPGHATPAKERVPASSNERASVGITATAARGPNPALQTRVGTHITVCRWVAKSKKPPCSRQCRRPRTGRAHGAFWHCNFLVHKDYIYALASRALSALPESECRSGASRSTRNC